MSERLKVKLGEELYKQILDKGIKESEFDLIDGYIPRQRFNEVNEKLKATESKITSYEKQLEDTKKLTATNEEMKVKYEELENKFNAEVESKNKEIENVLKRSLVKEKLINEGAKHPDLLLKEINFDDVQIKEDKLFGFDDTFKSINESYKDLFVEKVNQSNSNAPNNNNNDDGGTDEFSYLDNIKS